MRTLDLAPSRDEAIKPSELIQISGHQTLSLSARRAITILWHSAHMQGIEEGKDYSIDLADLKTEAHKGSEMVEEAVVALMQTILTVRLSGKRTRRVQFLGGNDMHDPDRPAGRLTYSFDKRLVEILRDSAIWGRIALPVLMAFSSKYAVSLYENACQWSNLSHKIFQELTLDELRSMLGVEQGRYVAFGALNKHVIKPALAEINALAPFNIDLMPFKKGKRVVGVRIGWWRKDEDELKAAWAEAQRPRVGRRARISGQAERLEIEPHSGSAMPGEDATEGGASPKTSQLQQGLDLT